VSRGSIWSVAGAVTWRTLHNVFTTPSLLLPGLMFPLLNFAAFAGGLSSLGSLEEFDYAPGYTGFQFVFVLLQSAVFGGVFTGFGIARDFEYGFAKRLLLGAPHRSGIVLGYVIAGALRWLMIAVIVTTVALVAGMDVGGGPIDLFGLYGLALLAYTAGILWATGVAMRFRSVQAGPLMQMPVFTALFFAPVYVPYELLEGWIQGVAAVNPFTQLIEGGRELLAGDPTQIAIPFAVALGLVAVLAAWAQRSLRSAERAG
jgi:ABC-2 type transport system permease protein